MGNGVFKLFRYSEGNLKQFAIQKTEGQKNYLCQTWVSDERVVVGTDNGRMMLFESGELKHEFNLAGTPHLSLETDRWVSDADKPPGMDYPYPIRILPSFVMIRPYYFVIRIWSKLLKEFFEYV